MAFEAVTFAKEQKAQAVWAVLDSPLSIAIAKRVAVALDVPLITTVWDDIEHNIRYFRLDPIAARDARRYFANALQHSCCAALIGEAMQSSYERNYGVQGVVVRHGLPVDLRLAPKRLLDATDIIRIGFAGSISARSAFEGLLNALDRMAWSFSGIPIELRLITPRITLNAGVPRRIVYLGWQPTMAEAVHLLADCHLNYLPQPFEQEWSPFTRLSFPSKLTTYLGAGAPLLLHTPPYGSLHGFFDRYPFGVRCDTLEPSSLIKALCDLLEEPERYRQAGEALTRALDEAFTAERFHSDFLRVLACARPQAD
ncbi:hypothetical protein [Thiocapsa imhoffii]|nr:hypothetical protein [Thiocapsa imhoffii]